MESSEGISTITGESHLIAAVRHRCGVLVEVLRTAGMSGVDLGIYTARRRVIFIEPILDVDSFFVHVLPIISELNRVVDRGSRCLPWRACWPLFPTRDIVDVGVV